jgi:hypothetical protein
MTACWMVPFYFWHGSFVVLPPSRVALADSLLSVLVVGPIINSRVLYQVPGSDGTLRTISTTILRSVPCLAGTWSTASRIISKSYSVSFFDSPVPKKRVISSKSLADPTSHTHHPSRKKTSHEGLHNHKNARSSTQIHQNETRSPFINHFEL